MTFGVGSTPRSAGSLYGVRPPAAATALRQAIADADGVLVVTPEYNGTMSGVLKNALDWASRPCGASPIVGKALAVIGSAFGQYGGIRAQDDARRTARIAGADVLEDVRMSVPLSDVRFARTHPREDAEIAEILRRVLLDLSHAAERTIAA